MPFEVSEESSHAPQVEAVALLRQTRHAVIDDGRIPWLYEGNPDGPAVLWAVRDGGGPGGVGDGDIKRNGESNIDAVDGGRMVGFTVCLPRRVWVDGEVRAGWNGADFSILPNYRTLGPAVKLRRAARVEIDAGRVDLLYAHPNERMAVIHARAGHQVVGRMVRFAKVLKTGPYLERRGKSRAAAGVISSIVDPVLRLGGREFRRRRRHKVHVCSPARFDERFDRLFERAAPRLRIVGVRDARFLNWRYAECPLYESHLITAENGDELSGYLVFTVEDGVGLIKDVFPPGDDATAEDLISAMIGEGRRRGLASLSFTALESNPLLPIIAAYGFRKRADSSQMFAYARPDAPWRDAVLDKEAWYLTVGDRDV